MRFLSGWRWRAFAGDIPCCEALLWFGEGAAQYIRPCCIIIAYGVYVHLIVYIVRGNVQLSRIICS